MENEEANYVFRMYEEEKELRGRLSRLREFISSEPILIKAKRDLLSAQAEAMAQYLSVLRMRIELETGEPFKELHIKKDVNIGEA